MENAENDLGKVFDVMDEGNRNISSRVVNSFMEEARKLGSSLLLMSSWYQCSKYIVDNPRYTNNFVSSRNHDLKKFKQKPSHKRYVKDAINTFLTNQTKTKKVEKRNPQPAVI